MTDAKYNLTAAEAIIEMEKQLAKMQAETDRTQLVGTDSDTAYELGYATAIFDLKHYSGPNPREVELRVVATPSSTD